MKRFLILLILCSPIYGTEWYSISYDSDLGNDYYEATTWSWNSGGYAQNDTPAKGIYQSDDGSSFKTLDISGLIVTYQAYVLLPLAGRAQNTGYMCMIDSGDGVVGDNPTAIKNSYYIRINYTNADLVKVKSDGTPTTLYSPTHSMTATTWSIVQFKINFDSYEIWYKFDDDADGVWDSEYYYDDDGSDIDFSNGVKFTPSVYVAPGYYDNVSITYESTSTRQYPLIPSERVFPAIPSERVFPVFQ